MHLHLSLLHKLVVSFNFHITVSMESDGKLYDPIHEQWLGKKFINKDENFHNAPVDSFIDKLVDSFF